MITQFPQVLSSQQVNAIVQLIEHGNFENGKDTAGWHAKEVKNNLQWQGDLNLTEEIEQCLLGPLPNTHNFQQHMLKL